METKDKDLSEAHYALQVKLEENLRGWKDIVREGIMWGIEKALAALRAVKEEVMKFCREHKSFIQQLTKLVVKTGLRQVAKAVTKQSTKVASKSLVKVANPLGIGADVVQAGFEMAGMEETGKKVGKYGNIASGVMVGAAVGGPPGAVIGAAGGFVLWGAGEVAGSLMGRAIGD